jgi:signal transduction histidine kinase
MGLTTQDRHPRSKLATRFAPAERAAPDEIAGQAQAFQMPPHLVTLLDTVPDFVMVLNEHRQVVFANRALREFIQEHEDDPPEGRRPGEIMGCVHAFESEGGCGTTEFCTRCGAVQAVLASLGGQESVQEARIPLIDGSALDLRVWASPLQVRGETYAAATVKDISDEKRRRALERIFFHDLLNAAGSVYGFAHLLAESPEAADGPFLAERIVSLSNQLVSEIMAQQELTAAENSELVVTPSTVTSTHVLNAVAEVYRAHAVTEGRHIALDAASGSVTLTTDATLLTRVLGNMLKNALEASREGEVVTLGCRRDGERVEFWVHNPRAMPREVQLQVFQRSFSTKGVGRGLGTYSIRLLSERYLQGEVSFTTSEEAGTTFFARYPLALR